MGETLTFHDGTSSSPRRRAFKGADILGETDGVGDDPENEETEEFQELRTFLSLLLCANRSQVDELLPRIERARELGRRHPYQCD